MSEYPDPARARALERLVGQYRPALLRMCCLLLQDAQLAEDAVQETFLKAYRAMDSFRGESSEKTWLTRIAANTCRDMQRTPWFRRTDRRVTPDMLPEQTAPAAERDIDLTIALMNLPARLRTPIVLYYYDGMDTKEIAQLLGIAQPTVSSRLKRGRAQLRGLLEGGGADA